MNQYKIVCGAASFIIVHTYARKMHSQAAYPGASRPSPLSRSDYAEKHWSSSRSTDVTSAYKQTSTSDLIHKFVILSLCQIQSLPKHAEFLLRTAKYLGMGSVSNFIVKHTFFKQFCVEEDQVVALSDRLKSNGNVFTALTLPPVGIGTILDFAAEREPTSLDQSVPIERLTQSIMMASNSFVALKLTSIYPPSLLESISASLIATQSCFESRAKANGMNQQEFAEFLKELSGYPQWIASHQTGPSTLAKLVFKSNSLCTWTDVEREMDLFGEDAILFACEPGGSVSVPSTTSAPPQPLGNNLKPTDSPDRLMRRGPKPLTSLDLHQLHEITQQLHSLCDVSRRHNAKIMMDAEQSPYQPAIFHISLHLSRKHNQSSPLVWSTYQMYLSDASQTLKRHLDLHEAWKCKIGCKLVRGAYRSFEADLARKEDRVSVVCSSKAETDQQYDDAIVTVMKSNADAVVASHNWKSVELAMSLGARESISFAQLYGTRVPVNSLTPSGMCDSLTFFIKQNGYRVYKYVPYGPVSNVIPYLIRRAEENQDLLVEKDGASERLLIWSELTRRRFLPLSIVSA